ncbi:MAG: 2-hydroxychromene-2-carboxylate isomerase [Rhodospirillales bacterium]
MAKVIDYYLTPISPWAYLGAARFAEIAKAARAEVRVKPVNFAKVLKEGGGLPLAQRAPARQAYRLQELERWRKKRKVELVVHPAFFPCPDALASRFILAADAIGGDPLRLAEAIGRAVWAEERNVADTATLQDIAEATGHDRITILAKAIDPSIETLMEKLTEEAMAKGVFGAPTYALGEELFWGQDRLPLLREALGVA